MNIKKAKKKKRRYVQGTKKWRERRGQAEEE